MLCGFENPTRMLLIDSGRVDRFRIMRALLRLCISVDCARSLEEAKDLVRTACSIGAPYAAICTEAELMDASAAAIFDWLGNVCLGRCVGRRSATFVVITGVTSPGAVHAAFRAGCRGWLQKPVDPTLLEHTLLELGLPGPHPPVKTVRGHSFGGDPEHR